MSKMRKMLGVLVTALVVSSVCLTGCQGGNTSNEESSLSEVKDSIRSKSETSLKSGEPVSDSNSDKPALSERMTRLKNGLQSGEFSIEMKQTVSTMNVSVKVVAKGNKLLGTMKLIDKSFSVLQDGDTAYLVGTDGKTIYKSKATKGSESLNDMFSTDSMMNDFAEGVQYRTSGKETIDGKELEYEEYGVQDITMSTSSLSSDTSNFETDVYQRYYFDGNTLVRVRSFDASGDIKSDAIVSKFEFKLSDEEISSLDSSNYTLSDESAEDMLSKMNYVDGAESSSTSRVED